MKRAKILSAAAIALAAMLPLTACTSSPSGGNAGPGKVGMEKFDGDNYTIYCDGDIAFYEFNYAGKSGDIFLHPKDKHCVNPIPRVKLTKEKKNFNLGGDLTLDAWCQNGNAVYSHGRRTIANIDDERCAKG